MRLVVRIGGRGQCHPHVALEIPGQRQSLLVVALGAVVRHTAVEAQGLFRTTQSLVEGGGELRIPGVELQQRVQFGVLPLGHVGAESRQLQSPLGLCVVQRGVLRVAEVVGVAAVTLLQRPGRRVVDLLRMRDQSVDPALQIAAGLLHSPQMLLGVGVGAVRGAFHDALHGPVAVVRHPDALLTAVPDRFLQVRLDGQQVGVGVAENVLDALGLGRRVVELLGGLVDERLGDAGVLASPLGLVGLGHHAGAGVVRQLLQLGDHRLPVRDRRRQVGEGDGVQIAVRQFGHDGFSIPAYFPTYL